METLDAHVMDIQKYDTDGDGKVSEADQADNALKFGDKFPEEYALKSEVDTAQGTAETAQGTAEAAQTAADDAQRSADTAQGTAEAAQTAADNAQRSADTAQRASEAAQGTAEAAQTAAEGAQRTAEAKPDRAPRSATVTVALEDAGYTAKDADILIPAGTADCIDYLDAAVDYFKGPVVHGGGLLQLLDGQYNISRTWAIDIPDIIVQGVGSGTNLNLTTGGAASVVKLDTVLYKYSVIRDLMIRNSTPFTSDIFGVVLSGPGNAVVDNCSIIIRSSENIRGIQGENTGLTRITNSRIFAESGGAYRGSIGLVLGSATGITSNAFVFNSSFESLSAASSGIVVGQNGYRHADIICNTFAAKAGVSFNNASAVYSNINISGNRFYTSVFGLNLLTAGSNNRIANNDFTVRTGGSPYTADGSTAAALPGSPTSYAAFGTGGVCGGNIV
jgi:hypothetical protein